MILLTANDPVSGIFSGQVTDVARVLRTDHALDVRTISCFPGKIYSREKALLASQDPEAKAIRSWFPLSWFRKNERFIRKYLAADKDGVVLARGPFACAMALDLKKEGVVKKVIYDGRGAVKAEFSEYDLGGSRLKPVATEAERQSVTEADLRISVSNKLVEWWRATYDYGDELHIVIPSSLDSALEEVAFIGDHPQKNKIAGVNEKDVLFAFSAGSGDWQSTDLIASFVEKAFSSDPRYKLLFLSRTELKGNSVLEKYKDRVVQVWVDHFEVPGMLACADYALLLRENSVTNHVASPVKFAEYLHQGLPVIISPNVGDYSELVTNSKIGCVWDNGPLPTLNKLSMDERLRIHEFAKLNFSKRCAKLAGSYGKLASFIKGS